MDEALEALLAARPDPGPAECRHLRDHALYAFWRMTMAIGPMAQDVVTANEGAGDREAADVLDTMAASLWAALEPLRPYIDLTGGNRP